VDYRTILKIYEQNENEMNRENFELWRTSVVEQAVSMPTTMENQYDVLLAKYMSINLAFTKELDDTTKLELMKRNILLSIDLLAPYLAQNSLDRLYLLKEHIEKNG